MVLWCWGRIQKRINSSHYQIKFTKNSSEYNMMDVTPLHFHCRRSWWLLSNLKTFQKFSIYDLATLNKLPDRFQEMRIIPYFIYVSGTSIWVVLDVPKICREFNHSFVFFLCWSGECSYSFGLKCLCCLFCDFVISHAVLIYPDLLLCTNKLQQCLY